jgi:hypothetical protein
VGSLNEKPDGQKSHGVVLLGKAMRSALSKHKYRIDYEICLYGRSKENTV